MADNTIAVHVITNQIENAVEGLAGRGRAVAARAEVRPAIVRGGAHKPARRRVRRGAPRGRVSPRAEPQEPAPVVGGAESVVCGGVHALQGVYRLLLEHAEGPLSVHTLCILHKKNLFNG